MRIAIVALTLGSMLAGPSLAQAQQVYVSGQGGYGQQPVYVQPPPAQPAPQPRTEERMHIGLAISGGVMLGVSWLIHGALVSPLAGTSHSITGGGSSSDPDWDAFRITGLVPLAGPWIQLALKPGELRQDAWAPYLVIDGALQLAGFTMLIIGVSVRETVEVYGRRGDPEAPSIRLGAGPGSVAVSGTF